MRTTWADTAIDSLIAATALHHTMVLVTRNVADFYATNVMFVQGM